VGNKGQCLDRKKKIIFNRETEGLFIVTEVLALSQGEQGGVILGYYLWAI
jgi:hypothetical protein